MVNLWDDFLENNHLNQIYWKLIYDKNYNALSWCIKRFCLALCSCIRIYSCHHSAVFYLKLIELYLKVWITNASAFDNCALELQTTNTDSAMMSLHRVGHVFSFFHLVKTSLNSGDGCYNMSHVNWNVIKQIWSATVLVLFNSG